MPVRLFFLLLSHENISLSTIDSLYSSLAGGYSNYQQSSGLAGVSQLSSSLTGSVVEMIGCSVA